MCTNEYATTPCIKCGAVSVRYHVRVKTCTKYKGSNICTAALQDMHVGPTSRTVCGTCDRAEPGKLGGYAPYIVGLPQAASEYVISKWRHDGHEVAFMDPFVHTAIADAASSGEQVLQQSFDLDLALMAANPPPRGMSFYPADKPYPPVDVAEQTRLYRAAYANSQQTSGQQTSGQQAAYAPPYPAVNQAAGYAYPPASTAAPNSGTFADTGMTSWDYSQMGYQGNANNDNGGEGSSSGTGYGHGQ